MTSGETQRPRSRQTRWALGAGAVSCVFVLVLAACTAQPAKKEYVFHGVVERVDVAAHTMSVLGADIPGWMMAMTMTYGVDKPEVIDRVKVGDQITAKVYEGDTKTLYGVQVVPKPASEAEAPPPAK